MEKRGLYQFQRALEMLRSHDEDMPVQRMEVFILAATRGRISRNDVVDDLGQSKGAAWRNLRALARGQEGTARRTKPSLGWLDEQVEEGRAHRKVWTLTTKGRRVADQLERTIRGAA